MRNLKRFLAMALTMLMVVSCFSFASFAQSFDDVYDYAKAIDTLTNLGVIWGYEDGTFGPDNTVERWHMSLWIAKMETGKVSTDDYLTTWKEAGNYTNFTDVTVDQAIGAINYASEEGIILGTSATTFAPTAGITYQDALTMVVRALGYGSSAMDAGYPWKYINKAAELGLEEGISGIAYKDVLTRAETAQVLYNALYTVDAAGHSYIKDVFGLTTVVITGTPAYKIINTESVIKTGYVSFNVLNADGTINTGVTYYIPATAFGIEAAKADTFVGASFQVTSDDNFKTIGTAIANPSEVFDAAKIVGQGTAAAPAGTLVTLGKDTYQAVEKYSSLYNAQGFKGNNTEILVYKTNATQVTSNGYFKVDQYNNVLDVNGIIVAYYNPFMTGSYAIPYVQRLADNTYKTFALDANGSQNAAIIAAKGCWINGTTNAYAQTTNTYDLVKNNKYASAVAYDDNADGVYDRLFYTYEEFGKIYINNDTPAVPNDYYIEDGIGRISPVVTKFIDGKTGEALATAPTGYIRYSYNPLSQYLTVYENYTYGTGLVTTVDTANAKIIIGGTKYSVGIGTYPGAAYANTGVNIGLVGKQVNFILADGVVVRVFDSAVASTWVVFDNFTGLTSTGYATALVYTQSNQASVITIATINGYSYQNYLLSANQNSLGNITWDLETGMLFAGTKDALGFWHLTTANYTYSAQESAVTFNNGIASSNIANFSQFKTNADTLYIVYNEQRDRFFTAKGIPANGSDIYVNGQMLVTYTADAVKTGSFVYVNNGLFSDDFATLNTTPVSQYDTVIYVDNLSAATCVTNDLGNATLLGYTYKYGRVLDMVSGNFITVYTTFNFQLQAGQFYTVSNGYVEQPTGSAIALGLLFQYGVFSSSIVTSDNGINAETSKYTYLYALDANGNVAVDAAGAIINYVGNAAAYNNVFVNYYDGNLVHNRVMLMKNTTAATLSISTPPAKVAYMYGETFDPAGLVLKLTNGISTIYVNYTNATPAAKSFFTFAPSTTTALTTANNNVVITFIGKIVNQPITVGTIAITGTVAITPHTGLAEDVVVTANIVGIQAAATYSYQWYKNSALIPGTYTAIVGATASTYELKADDALCNIVVKVIGTGLYSGTIESEPVGPVMPTL